MSSWNEELVGPFYFYRLFPIQFQNKPFTYSPSLGKEIELKTQKLKNLD